MNRKELTSLLDDAVNISLAKSSDGGLRYELNQAPAYSDIHKESLKAHRTLGSRGYEIKKLSPISELELKETLIEFTTKPLENKCELFTQKFINSINTNLSPYNTHMWEAYYDGYGLALVLAFESENGNLILAMDWTID